MIVLKSEEIACQTLVQRRIAWSHFKSSFHTVLQLEKRTYQPKSVTKYLKLFLSPS